MIHSILNGRCGNQLFTYSFSRKMAIDYDDDIIFYDKNIINLNDNTFTNDLGKFNLSKYHVCHDNINPVMEYGNFLQRIIYILFSAFCKIPCKDRPTFYRRQTHWQPLLNRVGIYMLVHGYCSPKKTRFKNKFIEGSWEDKRWFDNIRSRLISEITPSKIVDTNDTLLNIIRNTESVCVTIRRGDFLSEKYSKMRSICNEEYFIEAVRKMNSLVPECTYIFFSDEIEWVKQNYDFGINCYYESGNDSVDEKLRLMSSCKHFILSNSTFSWWAQYLATSDNKIVISPDHWFNMPGYKHQLIDDSWILLKC